MSRCQVLTGVSWYNESTFGPVIDPPRKRRHCMDARVVPAWKKAGDGTETGRENVRARVAQTRWGGLCTLCLQRVPRKLSATWGRFPNQQQQQQQQPLMTTQQQPNSSNTQAGPTAATGATIPVVVAVLPGLTARRSCYAVEWAHCPAEGQACADRLPCSCPLASGSTTAPLPPGSMPP
jgi:hypothetical protein